MQKESRMRVHEGIWEKGIRERNVEGTLPIQPKDNN